MANAETIQLDSIISSRRAMLAVGGAALAGLAFAPKAQAATINDNDILNFALNLEYLEAQFYSLAVNGVTIDLGPQKIPTAPNAGTLGAAGMITYKSPFAAVPFADAAIKAYAAETATEEGKHVLYLQKALGSLAVSMPAINLVDSFNTLANAATIGPAFDPFASDANFLIGAYIFEDTGVSAYHGAAPLISDKKNILPSAIGIHAVEAYHAGLVRFSINRLDIANGTSPTLIGYTQKISNLRYTVANPSGAPYSTTDDIGIMNTMVALNGTSATYNATTFADAPTGMTRTTAKPGYSIAAGRTTTQILAIVTAGGTPNGSGVTTGGFFPNGLNGTIK